MDSSNCAIVLNLVRRGYLLQDLLNRLFLIHQIPAVQPFTRNERAEQIDGAFRLEGWHYIAECRWREKLADIRQLDGLLGQVGQADNGAVSIDQWMVLKRSGFAQAESRQVHISHGWLRPSVRVGPSGRFEGPIAGKIGTPQSGRGTSFRRLEVP